MIDFDLAAAHPAYRDVIVETYGAPLPLLARPTFLTLDPKSATTTAICLFGNPDDFPSGAEALPPQP